MVRLIAEHKSAVLAALVPPPSTLRWNERYTVLTFEWSIGRRPWRLARLIAPGFPHHVTQRGNRRAPVFFEEADYALYRDLLAKRCRKASVACWAYCLMPNHVHLILVPASVDGLARAIGETHRQYTGFVNARARWTGHLFQGRFSSVVLDEEHLMLAARYVALNPVRAQLAKQPQDWAWSSLRAHLDGRDDGLVTVAPLLERLGGVTALIDTGPEEVALTRLRAAEATGRPLGSDDFVTRLEDLMQRRLRRQKPGRKTNAPESAGDLFAGTGDGPTLSSSM